MYEPDHILRILEERMGELGVSQVELGRRAFGVSDNTAIQSLKKGSSPAMDRVAAMAHALGLEMYLGLPRELQRGFSDASVENDLSRPEALRSGYHPIPWHHRAPRAGSSPVAFSRDWMASHALIPDTLFAVAPDQALVPGIALEGAVAVVDVAARQVQNGLFAILRMGQVILAYLSFARDVVVIAGKAPTDVASVVFPDDENPILVLGQVIWSGQLQR